MKKALVLGGFAIFVLASCSKDFTCKCTFPTQNGVTPPNIVVDYTDVKKKDAKEACDELTTTYSSINGNCELE